MEQTLKINPQYSFAEYLALEETEGCRYEYYRDKVIAMAGGSKNHNKIVRQLSQLLDNHFGARGCDVFQENIKLEIEKEHYYFYPDLIVTCNEDDKTDHYYVRHPLLVVEVLSDSTNEYDNTVKLLRYISIPSLQYYIMVSQKEALVVVLSRQKDSALFTYAVYTGLDAKIEFSEVGLTILIGDIYKQIDLGILPDRELLEL